MSINLEVTKPDRGAFAKFDSENQVEIRFVVDASQADEVKKLLDLPYGETFSIIVKL